MKSPSGKVLKTSLQSTNLDTHSNFWLKLISCICMYACTIICVVIISVVIKLPTENLINGLKILIPYAAGFVAGVGTPGLCKLSINYIDKLIKK